MNKMEERVNTGGLISFSPRKTEITPEREKAIDEAYEKAKIRKKRNKILTTIIILLIALGIASYFILS